MIPEPITVVLAGPGPGAGIGGVLTLHRNLVELVDSMNGYNIHVVETGQGDGKTLIEKLRVRLKSATCTRSKQFSGIFHAQVCESTIFPDAVWTIIASKGMKLISHIHCHKNALEIASPMQKIGWKLLAKRSSHLFLITSGPDEMLRDNGTIASVLPNFVRVNSLDLSCKKKVVLYAGRMAESKGIFLLLQAANYLMENGWGLRFAGSFSSLEEQKCFEELVSAHSNVTWVGPLEPEEVAAEMGEASIFALVSSWAGEILPLSILEAGASGCTVLATDVGSITDVIRHGRDGLIISTASLQALLDALSYLIHNTNIREQFSRSFYERVLFCFSRESTAVVLREVYAKACPTG